MTRIRVPEVVTRSGFTATDPGGRIGQHGVNWGNRMETLSRYQGALVGLAVGDALGTTLEFKPPAPSSQSATWWAVAPSVWSRDSGPTTPPWPCVWPRAWSLVRASTPADQMRRYVRWYREGYWSSTGTLLRHRVHRLRRAAAIRARRQPLRRRDPSRAGGNGSLMRLAPIPLAFANDPTEAMRLAGEMSQDDPRRSRAGGRLPLLRGADPGRAARRAQGTAPCSPLQPVLVSGRAKPLARGSTRSPPARSRSGNPRRSAGPAMWSMPWRRRSGRSGAPTPSRRVHWQRSTWATTPTPPGAIYGQLAGAYYGLAGIPERWRSRIALRDRILGLSDALWSLAFSAPRINP